MTKVTKLKSLPSQQPLPSPLPLPGPLLLPGSLALPDLPPLLVCYCSMAP